MKTYRRTCVEKWGITAENGDHFEVEPGKEYLTSGEENGCCVVFSRFWVSVPMECFK